MADLTDKVSVVTQAIVDLLREGWGDLKLQSPDDVYYGDQSRVPRFPSITVESGPQTRELQQTGLQERIGYTMYLMLYLGKLASVTENRKEADEISELVVGRLQTERRLDGYVIHGSPVLVEPGFAQRGGNLLVVHRITWEGISNHVMPQS